MRNSYRVVKDMHCGYEVQIKFWWFPLVWFQCHDTVDRCANTHSSLEQAEAFAKIHSSNKTVVKNIGKLP